SDDRGRIARSAYTYSHLPMVAGIIVTAVGDELVIGHPLGHAEVATIAAVLGGPALFLAGHALFKYLVFGVVSGARLVAIALLAAFVPVAMVVSPLAIIGFATAVVAGVAVHESAFHPSAAAESVTVEGA
ncbi:MAG TPA: low temperature requirement protein A, partial [Candidatus Limnocylindria bacterium]|nr:low temperature requirement protein A [Candidatus Limnocylindria bacterium]